MEPGILELCEAALRSLEDMGAWWKPVAPPFPAEELWDAWITLRADAVCGRAGARFTTIPASGRC